MRRAIAVAAFGATIAAAGGIAAMVMVGGAGCAATETRRAPDGAWRIEEIGCGATVGETWRVMVRGQDGRERLALESHRYPDATDADLAPGLLRVRLSEPGPWREVPLDAAGRPLAPLRLTEGAPRR
ncbi:hypothetical protein [Neoroseomonas oryzicola]|uniref:Uncharacterized protein n=1 Tax=Neoroseomonas oryzicola TaxID=535904 RepID=A0A9X9WD28_9PROT|nr:hypothetical protein [Neoroseomonas oryzicola]MBR0658238.1 hypothetical protein [Neoroseomonas oryzicola]NKE15945.1 hypothetical protein [Neoroseomonas oryzicola]